MARACRFRSYAAACPDRAVLVFGLLLTGAAYLAERSENERRARERLAAGLPAAQRILCERLRQCEAVVRSAHDRALAACIPAVAPPEDCPGLLGVWFVPGDGDGQTRGISLSVAARPQPGPCGRGLLRMPVYAAPARFADSADEASVLLGWAVAVVDLADMLGTSGAAPPVEAGVQLSRLPSVFGEQGLGSTPDGTLEFNYAGPRAVVASSVIPVGDELWLARWTVPAARGAADRTAATYAVGGAVASVLLFLGKRTWLPFVERRRAQEAAGTAAQWSREAVGRCYRPIAGRS
jgi:hypothetical protein